MAELLYSKKQPEFFSRQVSHARRFYLDLAVDDRDSLTVVCGGKEACLPDYRVERSDFPYFSLEFVSRGKGSVSIGDIDAEVSAGVAYTYGPGVPHTITTDEKEPLEKYFIDFRGSKVVELLDELALKPGVIQKVHTGIDLQRLLDDLIMHGQRNSGASSRLCDALMQYILLLVSSTAVSTASSQTPAYETYLRCREHIEQKFMSLQSLDDTAREMLIDKTYLCRLFRRFDNQTAYEFLTRLKMNKAAELLEDSSMLIKQIAFMVGYQDPFHFSRVFKSVFGVSPKDFKTLRN